MLDDAGSRKVYFIKRARPGEELTTLLKNKFKSVDAIRDILAWHAEGCGFSIQITDWGSEALEPLDEIEVEVSPLRLEHQTNKLLLRAIESIVNWLDHGRDFDISLRRTDVVPEGIDAELN